MAEDRCAHGHRGPMATDGTGCPTCLGEAYEEIAATCGLHPDTTLDVLLSFIESVRAEARVSADLASAAYHAQRERDQAREHRRRLFEALEGRLEDAPEWTPQFARALLDELRPHVAKEQG